MQVPVPRSLEDCGSAEHQGDRPPEDSAQDRVCLSFAFTSPLWH
jgi:hypothetical protein